jgi:hypothetical protein
VGLHNTYHCLCGVIGEECSNVDLWFYALLQTLPLRVSFRVKIKDFLLEFRARSRGMMTVSKNFLSNHSGWFNVL